jgi:DoxX-like family
MSTAKDLATSSEVQPKWMTIAGWVCTALVVAGLCFSASMKFMEPPKEMLEELAKIGIDPKLLVPIGVLELCCALIYLFPRTAVVGAVLVAGYMGGAILTHVRVFDFTIWPHILIGLLAWLGIFLREPRLRPIMFWR